MSMEGSPSGSTEIIDMEELDRLHATTTSDASVRGVKRAQREDPSTCCTIAVYCFFVSQSYIGRYVRSLVATCDSWHAALRCRFPQHDYTGGLPGDTWRYQVNRERLAEKSDWFRALLTGPLAPERSDPPPLLQLQHVEKRAFHHFLRYLDNERIDFQSVSTARATLDVAHQYLCPGLARHAISFLEKNMNSCTVLEIYQGLDLYADLPRSAAPATVVDDAAEIGAACTGLLLRCLSVIDADPAKVLQQERFEELTPRELLKLASRDSLALSSECVLFSALDRWAASECRRRGVEPTPSNKRAALSDDVWYCVRYLLMTDKEFIEGPMANGILSSKESAFIVGRILGHSRPFVEPPEPSDPNDSSESTDREQQLVMWMNSPLSRLSTTPRAPTKTRYEEACKMLKAAKKERQDNRKNRRKECANQGHRACARIGNCFVRVLACVFE